MSKYIDGFLIPIASDKLDDYKKLATLASQVWRDNGALEYIEAVGDDLAGHAPRIKPPTELLGARPGETLIFSYIVYESREHRDEVNAKAMADPRMKEMCPEQNPGLEMPFEIPRMIMGGFRVIVE